MQKDIAESINRLLPVLVTAQPSSRGYEPEMPVRVFAKADVDRLIKPLSSRERERFVWRLKLLSAVAKRDQSAAADASDRIYLLAHSLNPDSSDEVEQIVAKEMVEMRGLCPYWKSKPAHLLVKEMTWEMRDVRLVLWLDSSGRPRPAFYCSDNYQLAAYVLAFAGEWIGWEVCRNCGKVFRQSRPNKKWCDDRCGNAYRVRKSQAKTRAKNANGKTRGQ
jgi:hypothetical protein